MVTVIKGAISLLLMVIKAKLILQLRLGSLVKEIKRLLRSKLVDPGISHASVQLIEIPSHSVSTHSSITSNLPTGAEPHSRTEMPSGSRGEAQRQGESVLMRSLVSMTDSTGTTGTPAEEEVPRTGSWRAEKTPCGKVRCGRTR